MALLRAAQKWYLDKPIYQMRHDIPEMDPWCFFGPQGDWMADCALTHMHGTILHVALPILRRIRHRDPEATGKIPTRGLRHAAQKIRAEPANITYDGHSLSYRNFYHAYDDLLCDASGFWTLDRTILLNYSATREVGEAFCWHLHAKGLRFENISLGGMFNMESLERRAMAAAARGMQNAWSLGHPGGATAGVEQHEATKCALNDVACDISFCNGFGCVDAAGFVRYGPECPVDEGEPSFAAAHQHRTDETGS
jgi:hypothetical protein